MVLSARTVHDFLNLLFPVFCMACKAALERGEDTICTACAAQLPYTNYHLEPDNPLVRKFWGKVKIEHAMAYLHFTTGGKVQQLLHHLKYRGSQDVGLVLGRWYGAVLLNAGYNEYFDLLVPVPLHKAKQRQRGYNQSEVFVQGLSDSLGIETNSSVLRRTQFTETQTRKARLERWQNVGSVFEVTKPEAINGKRILLVDDVITTGSTLEACAQELYQAGCASVSVAAIAVA